MKVVVVLCVALVLPVLNCAQWIDQQSPYPSPADTIYKLQQQKAEYDGRTSSDSDQLHAITRLLTPENVFEQIISGDANVSDICRNQTWYTMETILAKGPQNMWAKQSKLY